MTRRTIRDDLRTSEMIKDARSLDGVFLDRNHPVWRGRRDQGDHDVVR